MFTLIDRIVGSESVSRTAEKVPVGADESILPQFLAYADENGLPSQVDMTYTVRRHWRADVPMYEEVRRRLTTRTRFRALCRPDEALWGTGDEIPLDLKPELVHIRSAWRPMPEYAILDQETALVKTRVDHRYALVIKVAVPELVRSLSEAFERNWRLSLTPQLYRRLRNALGSPVNQKVLHHLREGCIDEVAAKRMKVSVRTYRRYVSLLMEELQVETRFQMAWRLAQLGS
ncbi:hypothetical protein GCM10027447_37570 [Glycomyces halotolerans]